MAKAPALYRRLLLDFDGLVVCCSYAGYKEVPVAIASLTQLTCLKLENNCFRAAAKGGQPAENHAGRLLPLKHLRVLSLGSW